MVLDKVADGKGNYGYNAQTGEFGDMVEMGILDPTKVTRTALQNAASIAGLMITTEAMVAEAPRKESAPAGGHYHGGGMGGMDFRSSPSSLPCTRGGLGWGRASPRNHKSPAAIREVFDMTTYFPQFQLPSW